MRIGNLKLDNQVVLAPMAGVTDLPFRLLIKEQGCGLVCGEMVSAQALLYKNRRTFALLKTSSEERPISIQLFGSDPEAMARAAQLLAEYPIDLIDINMGCPAPKVVRHGEGAALLRDPKRAAQIVKAVTSAVSLPVTVKMRAGWARGEEIAPQLAVLCEEAKAAAIAVHGRFREEYYAGRADWSIITRVKKAVSIPVLGNGDLFSATDALRMLEQTGCDGVMIGRGVLGNPWLIREVLAAIEGRPLPPAPTIQEKFNLIRRHLVCQTSYSGEQKGVLEMRKHLSWYLKGFPGAAEARRRINKVITSAEIMRILEEYEDELIMN